MNALDRGLFHAINGWPDSMAPFWTFISELTKRPVGLALLVIFAITLLVIKKTRKATLLGLLAVAIANPTTDVLKNAILFRRPTHDMIDGVFRLGKMSVSGTASAHAANMTALAFVFWYLLGWKGGLPWAVVALLTGLSRIYVGVHYPSQVLLGALCGLFAGLLVVKTWESIERIREARRDVPNTADGKPSA